MIRHSKPWITTKDYILLNKILKSRFLVGGENGNNFLKILKQELGVVKDPLLTESGAKAIECALELIKKEKQREVILPSYLCVDVLNVVIEIGLKPVLVDVDECGFLSLDKVEEVMSEKTLAIIVPQLFGKIHDVSPFMQLGCYVIEDSCQNFDTSPIKTHFRTFSLGPTKPITAIRGGILIINTIYDPDILPKKTVLEKYRINLNEIESALGFSQLKKLSRNINKRRKIAISYTRTGVRTIPEMHQTKHQNFRFLVRHNSNFEEIAKYFEEKKIVVRRGVDNLLHQSLGLSQAKFPNSVNLYMNYVSIPIYPSLSIIERFRILRCLREINRNAK